MRRTVLVALFILPWGLLAFLLWQDLRSIELGNLDGGNDAHALAYQSFFADLSYEGCVPREAVVSASEARGWAWSALDTPRWCHRPELSDWLEVQVEPPLPFSTDDENAAFIGFDVNGCMARWAFASCD